MKRAAVCLMVVVVGLAGCGYKAKIEYADADHQRVETGDTSHHQTSQQRLEFKVAADLDREGTPKPTGVAPVAADPPTMSQPTISVEAMTVFIGGVHFHGDSEVQMNCTVERSRTTTAFKQAHGMSEPANRPDERHQRLRREHEERLADWLSKFN